MRDRAWLTKPGKALCSNVVTSPSPASTEAATITPEEAKKLKNKKRREARKKKKQDSPTDSALAATTPTSGRDRARTNHPNRDRNAERINEFEIDGVRYKGNTAPPAEHEQHKSRTFTKVNGSGAKELWWCWYCGNRGGMWKNHKTSNCPFKTRRGGRSPSPNRGRGQSNSSNNDDRRVRFDERAQTTGSANLLTRTSLSRPSFDDSDSD